MKLSPRLKLLALHAIGVPLAFGCFAVPSVPAQAQVLVSEGVGGDIDKRHRAPLLSASTRGVTEGVQILADASIPNAEYRKYPIRFEFYVNRELYSTQIRSPELPGPVGVIVDSASATVPFNYSVVATVLHTNRQFVSVIYGAVFSSSLAVRLGCTLSKTEGEAITEYVAEGIQTTQTSNGLVSIDTVLTDSTTGNKASIIGTLSVTGSGDATRASGDVRITVGDTVETVRFAGRATLTDGALSKVEVDSDAKYSLVCE